MNTSIYLIYSHKYNIGYVGRTANLRNRFYEHCGNKISTVKQFCDMTGAKPRDIFWIYEIIQCDKTDSMYYEGYIYDLIKLHFSQITLLKKNTPNRGKRGSTKNWRNNNPERYRASRRNWNRNNSEAIRENNKNWFGSHLGYSKHWRETHPNYFKDYYKKNKHRNK